MPASVAGIVVLLKQLAAVCYARRVKVLILYRPKSEHATKVESFVRDFQHQHDTGVKVELVSADTREGAATASLYDIWAFPTVMALADDGHMLNMWQGDSLPLMSEVAAYTYAS